MQDGFERRISSMDRTIGSTAFVVLGLLDKHGPMTPYELERSVDQAIGYFWSFPRSLLYKEPPRLVEAGLATEEREEAGRRRRVFTITAAGRAALHDWLHDPATAVTEIRDLGMLKLFFLGTAGPEAADLARANLAMHAERLALFHAIRAEKLQPGGLLNDGRVGLIEMGIALEQAATDFWARVKDAAEAAAGTAAGTGPQPSSANMAGSSAIAQVSPAKNGPKRP
jgi:DNA-binding PadR family transcriptional regulator